MRSTGCSKLLFAREVGPLVEQMNQEAQLQTVEIPSFQELFAMDAPASSRGVKSFDEVKNDPVLILHSSGSTGLPKPITMTHSTFAVLDGERQLPTVPNRRNRDFSIWDFEGGGKFYTMFPYFHLAGFLSLVVNPIFTESSSPVLGLPLQPPSGSVMKEVLEQVAVRAIYVPPLIAEQMLQLPNGLAYFEKLDFFCYTGGPFSPSAGQQLSRVTDLVPLYGSTEALQTPQLAPSKEDWAYMEWNPNFPHRMEPADEAGIYELVLFTTPSTVKISALNHNLPGVTEWRSKDLFKQHPSKPELWQYYGRRDDIVVFSNGEKFNPVPTELAVGASKSLSGALIVGSGRLQPGLLLEPRENPTDEDRTRKLIEEIWPLVERANRLASGQGRVSRSRIVIVPSGSFLRAGKGTVIRKMTEKKLWKEIEDLYAAVGGPKPTYSPPTTHDKESMELFMQSIINDALQATLAPEDDVFKHGIDSLKSLEILQCLKQSLAQSVGTASLHWIVPDLLYQLPTGRQLAQILVTYLTTGETPKHQITSSAQELDELIARYMSGLSLRVSHSSGDKAPAVQKAAKRTGLTVVLTGSTGSLGTAMLSRFLSLSEISNVHCLNRRHAPSHEDAFAAATKAGRVRFSTVQLQDANFGLDTGAYRSILDTADLIVHNAWHVDFSVPLRAFEQQLHGVRNLVELARRTHDLRSVCPRIVFVSSVSSVLNYPLCSPPASSTGVPEAMVVDSRCPLATGYAQSKFAAERLLEAAAELCTVPVTIVRLGQVVQAGADFSASPGGRRADRSWVAGLFRTSNALGCFPENICDIDWLQQEEAVGALVELSLGSVVVSSSNDDDDGDDGDGGEHETKIDDPKSPTPLLDVFNLVNPFPPAPWSDLLPELKKQGVLKPEVGSVSLSEWVARLREAGDEGAGDEEEKKKGESLPGHKLLGFYESLGKGTRGVRFSTERACAASRTLRRLQPVSAEVVARWCDDGR